MYFRVIITGLCLLSAISVRAQQYFNLNNLFNGQYMFDNHLNVYSNLWFNLLILDERNAVPDTEKEKILDSLKSLLSAANGSYIILEDTPDVKYIFIKHNDKYFFHKVLKKNEDFLLLCSAPKDLCECKAYTKIYVPEKNILKYVDKPLRFSALSSLKAELEQLGFTKYIDNEEDLCEFLSAL